VPDAGKNGFELLCVAFADKILIFTVLNSGFYKKEKLKPVFVFIMMNKDEYINFNKMQLETAEFAFRCRHLANCMKHSIIFDSGVFAPLCENMTSSTNLNYITYCIVVRGVYRATATGTMYRKFCEIWICGF